MHPRPDDVVDESESACEEPLSLLRVMIRALFQSGLVHSAEARPLETQSHPIEFLTFAP